MAGTDNRRLLATGKDTQLFSEETDSAITFITDSAEGSNTFATLEKNKVQPQTVKKIVDLWKQNEYITRESNITIKNQATMPSPRIVTPEFCYLTGLSDSLRLQVTSSRIYDFGQETIEEDGIIINASFPAENYHHRNRYDIHDCDDCYLGIGRFTQYYIYHRESNGYPDIANGYRGPMYLCGEAALLSFFFGYFGLIFILG